MKTLEKAIQSFMPEKLRFVDIDDWKNPVIKEFVKRSSFPVKLGETKITVTPNSVIMAAREAGKIIYRLANPKTKKGSTPRTGAVLCWSEPKPGSNAGEIRYAQALTIDMQRDILGTVCERLAYWGCFETGKVSEGFWNGDGDQPGIWSQIRNKTGLDLDRKMGEFLIPEGYDSAAPIIDEIDGEKIVERYNYLVSVAKMAHKRDNSRERESNYAKARDLIDLAFTECMGWSTGWVDWRDRRGKRKWLESKSARVDTRKAFEAYMQMGV